MPPNYARFLYIYSHNRNAVTSDSSIMWGCCAKKFRVNREFHMLTSETSGKPNVRCDTDASTAPEFQNAGQQTLPPKEIWRNFSHRRERKETHKWLRGSVKIQSHSSRTRIYCVKFFRLRQSHFIRAVLVNMHKSQHFTAWNYCLLPRE